jgi:hypothetical protein
MTRTQALAERGLDIEDVLRERQAEDEMIASFNVNLEAQNGGNA